MINAVLLGNNSGVFECANKLRGSGKEISVTVISDEEYLPYKKSLLPDLLLRRCAEVDVFCCDEKACKDKGINFLSSCRLSRIDHERRKVQLTDGRRVGYDFLLFANDRRSDKFSVPGINKHGVVGFDSLSALKEMQELLLICRHAVVIGYNPIALEICRYIISKGVDAVFFPRDGFDPGAVADVNMVVQQEISEFIGESDLRAVKLSSGKVIAASMAVFVGKMSLNTELLNESGLEIADSLVKVNERYETSLPDVYAIGDAVSLPENGMFCSWHKVSAQGAAVGELIVQRVSEPK